ncbi:MAG: sulfur oxidation c-type cytochrome SoxA [Rhodospirillales bacterium]|nr:sulfur oxidation c-type cytochrome SoxA [Rhodospirillales bacterium]
MRKLYIASLLIGGMALGSTASQAEDKDWGAYKVGDKLSGYTYATKETRAIQDDDFENPAQIWVDQAEGNWSSVEGEAGKSCESCHNAASDSMKGVATRYPVLNKNKAAMVNVEQQINFCRTSQMKAKAWKWESAELLGMTAFVKLQSRGMPVNVKIDGPVTPYYEKGKAFYYERRGQLDMACKHCHEDNPGKYARANLLSQGQSNGFPTYRLKWQKIGSLHRRFRGCNKNIRAQPFAYGAPEYVNLELYLNSRGQGLPVETPSVRN